MPLLTPGAVHIDQPLTNLTLAYLQDQSVFLADKIFPVVGVQKQRDNYYIYDRANMNRSGDVKLVSGRTELNRIGQKLSYDTYDAKVWGLAMDFDEQTLANEDSMLDIRAAGAETLMNRLLIHREEQFVDTFFTNNANWPTFTVQTGWSDIENATPIADITVAMTSAQLNSGGFKPNTMIVGKGVRDVLVNHPDILTRLNGGATVQNPALVTDNKLAEIFGVTNFYVLEAVKNTTHELAPNSAETESPAFIGANSCLLVYTPPAATLMTPAAGLTFAWNSLPGVNNLGVTVESFSDDALRRQQISEHIQVKMSYDMKVVGQELGIFNVDPLTP